MSRRTGLISGLVVLIVCGVLGVTLLTSTGNGTTATAPDATAPPLAEEDVTEAPATIAATTLATTPTPPNTDNDSDRTQAPTAPTDQPDSLAPCIFDAQADPVRPQAPAIDTYTFSEPEVIYAGLSLGIAEWLPDNHNALITHVEAGDSMLKVLDTQTGQTQHYVTYTKLSAKPTWLAQMQAVAFTERDSRNQIVLKISKGDETEPQVIASNLASAIIASSPSGEQVLIVEKSSQSPTNTHIQVVQEDGQEVQHMTSNLALQSITKQVQFPANPEEMLRAAWSTDNQRIAFYDQTAFYLFDATTGQTCMIDLGQYTTGEPFWAFAAKWSPNNRFIAIQTTIGAGLPLPFQYITMLDTKTGTQQRVAAPLSSVYEFSWGKKDTHLMLLARTGYGDLGQAILGLYVVDIITGDLRQVLPDTLFGSGLYTYEGGGLAWSRDGKYLLTRCPLFTDTTPIQPVEDRICLTTIDF